MDNKTLVNVLNKIYGFDSSYNAKEQGFLCSYFDEDEKNFVAEFPVPGLEASQISVKTAPNKLKIEAEPSEEQSKRGISGLNIDFSLPMSADIANTKADLNLGILTLTIPKKTDGGYKKVTIKTS